MLKRCTILLALVLGMAIQGWSQNDPVLFKVEETPIGLEEFKYIYSKTNGDKADFSRQSLQEYLDLYVKFKLKVHRAKEMQLDTIESLQNELEGYRKQLANSYLVDKEVTERLVKEAYERTKRDINISHIMISIKPGASAEDTLKAYKGINRIKQLLDQGQDFAELAKKFSDDKTAKNNGGNIGFVTALLPNGFYNLESVGYGLKKGEVSTPFRTGAGYHVVKLEDSRPARGQIEAAHILIRHNSKNADDPAPKQLADSLYTLLQAGGDFAALARQYSQDKPSAPKGGNIGYFGINKYERVFEDAAFGIEKDSTYTQPIKSRVGWHIIKRINKKDIEPYDIARRRLQPKIQKDGRYQLAKQTMVERIKREANFQERTAVLNQFVDTLSKGFLSYKWKAGTGKERNETLFTLGKTNYNLGSFADHCQKMARRRVRSGKGSSPQTVAREMYTAYLNDQVIKYEEQQLESKYPEFKALMREYEEGILLFEATKMTVWDKASQDSTGLANFHASNKSKYMWGERARVTIYTVRAEGSKQIKAIRKAASKGAAEKVLAKFNKDKHIAVQEKLVEKGKNDLLEGVAWKKGSLSKNETNTKNNSIKFIKIEEILSPSEKTLQEARGFIIANYQDHLEQAWLKELENAYQVNIDQKVFDSLIQ
ncbi:MAG: peptidylprolyl isomerase [Bacteroidota bacterium]